MRRRFSKQYISEEKAAELVEKAVANIDLPDWGTKQPLTASQHRVLARLVKDIAYHDFYGAERYEFKRFDLTYGYKGRIFLVTETGLIGDEDTYASVLCRNRRHMCIGVRGGVQAMSGKKSKCTNYVNTLIFGVDH